MKKKQTKTQRLVKSAFHEVFHNSPHVVTSTIAKKGAVRGQKQKIAIALNKARAAGARLSRPRGK